MFSVTRVDPTGSSSTQSPRSSGSACSALALGDEDLNDHAPASSRPADGGAGGQARGQARGSRAGGGQIDAEPARTVARDAPTKYRKIAHEPAAIEALFVVLSSSRRTTGRPSRSSSTSTPRTASCCTAIRKAASSTATMIAAATCLFTRPRRPASVWRPSSGRRTSTPAPASAQEVARHRRAHSQALGRERASCCAPTLGSAREALDGLARDEPGGLRIRARPHCAAGRDDQASNSCRPRRRRPATGKPARRLQGLPPRHARQAGTRPPRSSPRRNGHNGEADPRSIVYLVEQGRDERPLSRREGLLLPAARWRTGSRNAKATCSPTEPRPQPCAPTSCGSGSPRSPMRSCALSGHRPCPHPVRRSDLRHNPAQAPRSSPVPSASARGASNSRSPQPVPTPTNGGWPPPASSQPPDASPRRRKTRQSNPPPTGDPQTDRPHPRKPRQGRARPRHGHCAIIVGSRKTKPLR